MKTTFDSLDIELTIAISSAFDTGYTANVRFNALGGRYFESGPGRKVYRGVSVRLRFGEANLAN